VYFKIVIKQRKKQIRLRIFEWHNVEHGNVIFITTTINILYHHGTISHHNFGLDHTNVGTRARGINLKM
jgi:hypothetical protein